MGIKSKTDKAWGAKSQYSIRGKDTRPFPEKQRMRTKAEPAKYATRSSGNAMQELHFHDPDEQRWPELE